MSPLPLTETQSKTMKMQAIADVMYLEVKAPAFGEVFAMSDYVLSHNYLFDSYFEKIYRNLLRRNNFVNYFHKLLALSITQPRDSKFVAIVVRWSLFRGSFVL